MKGIKRLNSIDTYQLAKDTDEASGFIRKNPLTTGVIELSPDGTKIISKIGENDPTVRYDGVFYDGTVANAREFIITPIKEIDGGDGTFIVYVGGVRKVKKETERLLIENASGLKFIYYNLDYNIDTDNTFSFEYFEDKPIVATVYGNALTQELVNFGDERHGIQMDGFTHRYLHFTEGCKWVGGMDINGLTSGGTTYSEITAGFAYDEDIEMKPLTQTNAPFLYMEGEHWTVSEDLNDLGLIVGTQSQYNKDNLGTWGLEDVTGNDCTVNIIALTNNIEFPYVKIIGQTLYSNKYNAKDGIYTELNDLLLTGLPSPEFLPIGAIILNASGELQDMDDGSLYLDLRKKKFQ